MKKRKRLTIIAAAILIATVMASCSAKSDSVSNDRYSNNYFNEVSGEYGADYSEADSDGAENLNSSENGSKQYEDKIIRNAAVYMESDDAQKCYDKLLAFVKENGGSEMDMNKESNEYETYSYVTITAKLQINPDKLDKFIAFAEETDEVTSSSVSSNDVTAEYYDMKVRLESKKKALENYYKLLDKAENIKDSLEIQSYIEDLTEEIESIEGKLKYYDAKIDLSTIDLTITQRSKQIKNVEDDFEWNSLSFSDVITLIKNGFLSVVNFLWSLLLWLIIIVAVLSPIVLIAAVIIILVRRYRKKHPKTRNKKPVTPYNTINYGYGQPVPPTQPKADNSKNNDANKHQ